MANRLTANLLLVLVLVLMVASCRPPVFPPKPQGYFRIDTPAEHHYEVFDMPGYPYTFEYPANSIIEKDTVFMGEKADNPYWINIIIPKLGGIINITYKEISAKSPLDRLMSDAWGLSFFHHEKADFINETEIPNEFGSKALLFTVGGNSASRYQFLATDSVKHFMRGALYFDVTPNADSLLPATDFLATDIVHLLRSLKWKPLTPKGGPGI
jgi:gliding motility-associated lipoprotein GldD